MNIYERQDVAPKTAQERKRDEIARRKSAGYVWRGMWVLPEVWDSIRAFADKANRKAKSSNSKSGLGMSKEETQ